VDEQEGAATTAQISAETGQSIGIAGSLCKDGNSAGSGNSGGHWA
jgi:hypothetical protein